MLNHVTAQIFVCLDPVDMRKSFDTLARLVRDHLGHEPLSGAWFIFRGKARDRLKIGPGLSVGLPTGILRILPLESGVCEAAVSYFRVQTMRAPVNRPS
jgi:hypothetical protein